MTTFIFKHRNNNVYDVWLDNGWENWTKLIIGRDKCHVVAGARLPSGLLKEIHKTILS